MRINTELVECLDQAMDMIALGLIHLKKRANRYPGKEKNGGSHVLKPALDTKKKTARLGFGPGHAWGLKLIRNLIPRRLRKT